MRTGLVLSQILILTWVTSAVQAAVYVVHPDRVSGDFPTIQDAIDAALDGDVIRLENGIFNGPGNRAIDYLGKAITIESMSGRPESCIIDVEGTENPGVFFRNGEGPASILASVSIYNASYATGGAAIYCTDTPSSPTIRNCILAHNVGVDQGAALFCWNGSPTLERCTISRNTGPSVIHLRAGASVTIDRCIIAFNNTDAIVQCATADQVTITCTDVAGNNGNDWTGCIEDRQDIQGNFSLDPGFCNWQEGDFGLLRNSPCLPDQHPDGFDCGIIGARGPGCRETVYDENFSSEPGFTVYEDYVPQSGEYFDWNGADYEVRLAETTDSVQKFAVSPAFTTITESFEISIDINVFESSFGFPIGIRFSMSDDLLGQALVVGFRGGHNPWLTVGDGAGNVYPSGPGDPFPYNVWHRVEISYDSSRGTATIQITEIDSGEVYASWTDVSFSPTGFDRVVVGNTTGNGDGSWAEIRCDNILVATPRAQGACCFDNGACLNLVESQCLSVGGEFAGIGSGCDLVDCVDLSQVDVQVLGGEQPAWSVSTPKSVTELVGYYRLGGSMAFLPMESFTTDEIGQWTADLVPSDYSIRGLEYYLVFDAGPSSLGSPTEPVRHAVSGVELAAPDLPSGTWRMIAAPLNVAERDDLYGQLEQSFGTQAGDRWRMGTWDAASEVYESVDGSRRFGLEPGTAYWVGHVDDVSDWSFTGETNFPEKGMAAFEFVLRPGWNMIGNPAAYTLSLRDSALRVIDNGSEMVYVDAADAGLVSSHPYFYDKEATPIPYVVNRSVMMKWEGCWIENLTDPRRDLTLRVPAEETTDPLDGGSTGGAGILRSDDSAYLWSGEMRISTSEASTGVAVGLIEGPTTHRDDLSMPPGVPGQGLEAWLVDPTSGRRLYRDVETVGDENVWLLELHGTSGRVRIEWSCRQANDLEKKNHAVVLHEPSSGRTWDLAHNPTIDLPAGSRTMRIVRWSQPPVVTETPDLWTRAEPNPSPGQTLFRYKVPGGGDVYLQIYDSAGSRILQLQRTHQTGGEFIMFWDGRDDTAGTLPGGVYFMRMEWLGAEGRTAIKKKLTIVR